MISDINIKINPESCLACGECVDRCIMDNLRLSIAPCRQACPLTINCQAYLRLVAKGRAKEAAEYLRKDTPFGELLGRICTHPCETACQRNEGTHDGGVNIRAVKRYLAEKYPEIVNGVSKAKASCDKTAAIVGSGPAGLMAAYELAMVGINVTVFEAQEKPGGLLRYGIPEYRLPECVVDRAIASLISIGVRFETGVCLGKDLSLNDLKDKYDVVLLAIGLQQSLRPLIPGNDLTGVFGALDILKGAKEGKRTTADSAIVIGGGATAMDTALTLKKMGVAHVTMLVMESSREMPIPEGEREEALEHGIVIENRWGVTSVDKEGESLVCNMQRCLSVFDADGRFAPEMDEGDCSTRAADIVVFAIGQGIDVPQGISLSSRKLINSDEATGKLEDMANVFAAGDCSAGASSVVAAMASGQRTARCIIRFVNGQYPLALDAMAENGWVKEYEAHLERSNGVARGSLKKIPLSERSLDATVELCLTDSEAQTEAQRCMACGRAFEANKTCWFCLPCEIDCPEQALTVRMPYLVR